MLDVYAARQAYKEHDISNVGFVRSNQNIADGLTKCINHEAILNVITTGKLSIKVEHRKIRKPKDTQEESH